MRTLFALAVAAIVGSAACSNGSAVDVSGNWNYTASFHDTMPVLTCNTTSGTMQLAQSASNITGTYANLAFTCTGADANSFGPYSGNVLSGTITGGSTLITITVPACCGGSGTSWQNTGTATNNSMSGSLHVVANLDGTQYTLFGTWSATKQ